jgi:gluconolactonase
MSEWGSMTCNSISTSAASTDSIPREAPLHSSDGILYGAQSGSRRIVKFNPDGSTNQLTDRINGPYHNHPFDLDVDSHGRIWFSDPYSPIPTPRPQLRRGRHVSGQGG